MELSWNHAHHTQIFLQNLKLHLPLDETPHMDCFSSLQG